MVHSHPYFWDHVIITNIRVTSWWCCFHETLPLYHLCVTTLINDLKETKPPKQWARANTSVISLWWGSKVNVLRTSLRHPLGGFKRNQWLSATSYKWELKLFWCYLKCFHPVTHSIHPNVFIRVTPIIWQVRFEDSYV